jgi:3-oxo-5alpha-steroid 4-dehydrogenase
MQTSDPLIVEAEEVGAWSGEADLVVIGFGIASVCGAIEAREAGAEVLVL